MVRGLSKISFPRAVTGLICPSKQVGLISGSIAPRMVFVPIHTRDITDSGS